MPNAPIQMTRAQYQEKYGVAPNIPAAQTQSSPQQQPMSMTRAQYQEKYGQAPNVPPPGQKEPQTLVNPTAEAAKGFGKGVLGDIRSVAGVDTNPVVKDMASHSPAMQSALDSEKTALESTNGYQTAGKIGETLAASALPIGEVKQGVGLIGKVLTGEKDAVLSAVSPRLTPKVASETSTKTVGLLNKIVPVSGKKLKSIADTVRPFFNPKGTWSENAQKAGSELTNEANKLEISIDSVNHPIVIKELGARLKNVEEPMSLKGTSFEKQIGPLKDAAVKLTKESGGTVKGTFQALRKFDDYVEKTWPTLWDRENAPMRNAVTSIRNEWKNFIGENLPKDSIYRDSLKKQSNLFDARDTFREKAAKGELQRQGEIGTNSLQRFAEDHPKTIEGLKYGSGILGGSIVGGEIAGHTINSK